MEKKRSIAWSHKANIQYYNILTFWAENNQSIDYIESIEKQVICSFLFQKLEKFSL